MGQHRGPRLQSWDVADASRPDVVQHKAWRVRGRLGRREPRGAAPVPWLQEGPALASLVLHFDERVLLGLGRGFPVVRAWPVPS